MSDLVQMLPLWKALQGTQMEFVLATVVHVEGSGYRKPGARMLVAADGRRAGTISGGCLEAEVARKAFWHTESGPALRRYSTTPDDGDVPYGSGCGGVVHVLLERRRSAGPLLHQLNAAFEARAPLAVATLIEGENIAQRAFWPASEADASNPKLLEIARQAYAESRSFSANLETGDRQIAAAHCEFVNARPGIFVFGAGDDALPLIALARELGWYTAVADGRAHLATPARFPLADDHYPLSPGASPPMEFRPTDIGVIMTHSLEQDTRFLAHLLRTPLAYLGVLGPLHRTRDILSTIAAQHTAAGSDSRAVNAQVEEWLSHLHAPMGLDLGGTTPADIALAILAEIQQTLHRASGQALRQVRGRTGERIPLAFDQRRSAAG